MNYRNHGIVFQTPTYKYPAERFYDPLPARYAAFELEIDNIGCDTEKNNRLSNLLDKYKCGVTSDGSLGSGGFEIRMSPAKGAAFVKMYEEVGAALIEADANLSTACGAHVHFDMRETNYWNLRAYMLGWIVTERALYATQSHRRQKNTYCAPTTPLLLKYFDTWRNTAVSDVRYNVRSYDKTPKGWSSCVLDTTSGRNVYSGWKETSKCSPQGRVSMDRYRAFNLDSYWRRKTVEVRLHAGIRKPQAAIGWASVIDSLFTFADTVGESYLWRRVDEQQEMRAAGADEALLEAQKALLLEACGTTKAVAGNRYLRYRWQKYGTLSKYFNDEYSSRYKTTRPGWSVH